MDWFSFLLGLVLVVCGILALTHEIPINITPIGVIPLGIGIGTIWKAREL